MPHLIATILGRLFRKWQRHVRSQQTARFQAANTPTIICNTRPRNPWHERLQIASSASLYLLLLVALPGLLLYLLFPAEIFLVFVVFGVVFSVVLFPLGLITGKNGHRYGQSDVVSVAPQTPGEPKWIRVFLSEDQFVVQDSSVSFPVTKLQDVTQLDHNRFIMRVRNRPIYKLWRPGTVDLIVTVLTPEDTATFTVWCRQHGLWLD